MADQERIYLSSPHMGGSEQTFVQQAFDTNWIAPLGPNVSGFEQDLENYLGQDKHVASLSSGTAALHLALILLGVGTGDEVICQSFTFAASANPVVYQGGTPVYVDSEPDTWNICPHHLREAITDRIKQGKKPKAIIGVHLYGIPYKVDEVHAVANEFEIPVIEDAAEALGSTYKGQKCGTFGQYGVLSFNGNKIITTSGGGALVCHTRALKEKAVFLATQARDTAPHYQHSEIGYNYRMSNICAGIGRGQMEVLDSHIALRRANYSFYQQLLADVPGITFQREPAPDFFSNRWLSCILIDPKLAPFTPEQLRLHLETQNIESRPLWKPMHLQPVYKSAPFYGSGVSARLFKQGLCLPSGSNLTDVDRQRIALSIRQLL